MKLGIQILNYNSKEWLPGLFGSLSSTELGDHQVYLIDNASVDGSVEYVRDNWPNVRIIQHEENLGYAAAYNCSIPEAFSDRCDWVCLMNADVLVTCDWLSGIRRTVILDDRIGIIGPSFLAWESDEPSEFMMSRHGDLLSCAGDGNETFDTDWVEGSVFFIRRNCFEDLGGFNQIFFLYWEEAEYCRRAIWQGWRVVVATDSFCRHYSGGSSPETTFNLLRTRNHFIYKLTDPNYHFLINLLKTIRLLASYLSQTVVRQPSLLGSFRVVKAFSRATLLTRVCFVDWGKVREREHA